MIYTKDTCNRPAKELYETERNTMTIRLTVTGTARQNVRFHFTPHTLIAH